MALFTLTDWTASARARSSRFTRGRGIEVLGHLDQLLLFRKIKIDFEPARSGVVEDLPGVLAQSQEN